MIFASSTTTVSFPQMGLGPWELKKFLVEDLFGKFSIAWYGVIICFAMILACAVILRNAVKKEGFLMDSFLDYFLLAIPIGVIGARAMYVMARPDLYDSFAEMIAVWEGGLAIYGGVIAGAITILIAAKIKKHNPLKVLDAVVPGVLLAQSIGRWGNFVNGEAYGEPMEKALFWGMKIGNGPLVHPTFLYESILTFAGFGLAMFVVYRFKKIHGQVFCFYLVWYGIGRVLVEGLRSDSLMVGSLRLSQCIGVFSALLGIALFMILYLFDQNKPALETETEEAAEAAPNEKISVKKKISNIKKAFVRTKKSETEEKKENE